MIYLKATNIITITDLKCVLIRLLFTFSPGKSYSIPTRLAGTVPMRLQPHQGRLVDLIAFAP